MLVKSTGEHKRCLFCRHQGIGKGLLRKLLEDAAGQEVVLTTISSRIPFYAAEGFERLQLSKVPRCEPAGPA